MRTHHYPHYLIYEFTLTQQALSRPTDFWRWLRTTQRRVLPRIDGIRQTQWLQVGEHLMCLVRFASYEALSHHRTTMRTRTRCPGDLQQLCQEGRRWLFLTARWTARDPPIAVNWPEKAQHHPTTTTGESKEGLS